MWRRNPHCFWCGIETVLDDGPKLPPNAATVDHIRSRFCLERAERADGRWRKGILVLACSQCNNDRGSMEQAFLKVVAPHILHEKCKSPPAPPSLTRAQARLCGAILAFLKMGGSLYADTFKQHKCKRAVLGNARHLQREYEQAAERRRKQRSA